MSFDFDTVPERRNTDSQKWQKYPGRDILPMWVADMDFHASPAIIDALHRRVEHGIFGYARPVRSTVDAVVDAFQARYAWKIDPAWLVWLPGLVVGLNVTANAFASPGDEVISFTPVYPPFMLAPKFQGRTSIPVPLVLQSSSSPARPGAERASVSLATPGSAKWTINFEALEKAVTPKTKLLYLCHPHNPIARIWRRDELIRLAEFCVRHDIVLCSDEIHCDLILDPSDQHVPVALCGVPKLKLVTLMAPSKTYNVPGLGTSLAIISDPALRARFVQACSGIVAEVTTLGFAACEAAYRDSEPWRQELLAYLRGNRDYLIDFVARHLPGIKIEAPIEATYLAWLNVEGLRQENPAAFFESHGVGLSDGAMFGVRPGRYVRINFGCPRATLAEALNRMKKSRDGTRKRFASAAFPVNIRLPVAERASVSSVAHPGPKAHLFLSASEIDSLQVFEILKEGNLPEAQARAMTLAIQKAESTIAADVKTVLQDGLDTLEARIDTKMHKIKSELLLWSFAFWVAQLAAVAGLLKLLK